MEVIPSIDIKDGRCVRLYQGDYARVTVNDEDPVRVAREWQRQGARLVHLVDLDGAATGEPRNSRVVERIAALLDVPVQVGGGVRSIETAERLFSAGVGRVIFGTAAVRDPTMVARAVERWGDKVAVDIGARGGKAATDGWQNPTEKDAVGLARELAQLGVGRVIYTDVSRDGTLTEPNYSAMAEMVAAVPAAVVASGGVAKLEHIEKLAATGVAGVIVGRALYAGTVSLRDAIELARAC